MSQAFNKRVNVAIFTGDQVQEVQERVNDFLLKFEDDQILGIEIAGLENNGRFAVLVRYEYFL